MSDKSTTPSATSESAPDPAGTTRRVKARAKKAAKAAAKEDRRDAREPVETMQMAIGPNPTGHTDQALAAQRRGKSAKSAKKGR